MIYLWAMYMGYPWVARGLLISYPWNTHRLSVGYP